MGGGGLSPGAGHLDHGAGCLLPKEHADREVMGDPGGSYGREERVIGIQVDGSDEEIVRAPHRLLGRYPLLPAVDIDGVNPMAGPREAGREFGSAMDGIEDEDLHGMIRGAP
jgi:hypothetical protein